MIFGCEARRRPEAPVLLHSAIDQVVVPACVQDPRSCGHSSTAVCPVAIARASHVVRSADIGDGPALARQTAGVIIDGGKILVIRKSAGEVGARPRLWAGRAAEYK